MIDAVTLVKQVKNTRSVTIIQEAKIGIEPNMNEFLIFLKPEMFLASEEKDNVKRLNLVLDKLMQFNVNIDGIIAVNGHEIEEKQIMASHYGLINSLSRNASKLATIDDRTLMTKLLGEDCSTLEILGGHELIAKYPKFTPSSLDDFWFTRKSLRVRSGYYFQKYDIEGSQIILVNAFHPNQLAYFTDMSHYVLLLVCHSNTHWKTLRWQMIGDTFPEKAESSSIRGTLCEKSQDLGFNKKVDISCNGVHFSVGPFEGVKELNNFIGKVLGRDIVMETSFARYMLNQGMTQQAIRSTLENPKIQVAGVSRDLFGATEDMNPVDAIKIYMQNG